MAGEIIELPVEDGKAVHKDDLLVKIKPDSYKALLEAQEAAISAAKANNLQQKATMLKTAQDLKRAEDMFAKKTISIQEFNAAQAASDVAKNTYESSLHEIERAQAGSSQARDQLSKTTVYSPIDGTITILNSKLGERIVGTGQFAGTEVMRVADLNHMEARVDVNENDVVNVKVGDKANIKIDAYGDRKFHGTVYLIANTGTTTGSGTQEEVTNFQVKIRIDDHDVMLKPGLSCTADIETNMVKDAVAVPMQAVTIRTGDSNLSPEEIEKKKQKAADRDKGDNNAEFTNQKLEKAAQREEREKLAKVVFRKKGGKARDGQSHHRHFRRHLHGDQERDSARRRSDLRQLQRNQPETQRRRQSQLRQGNVEVDRRLRWARVIQSGRPGRSLSTSRTSRKNT